MIADCLHAGIRRLNAVGETFWRSNAADILADLGYEYDSSIDHTHAQEMAGTKAVAREPNLLPTGLVNIPWLWSELDGIMAPPEVDALFIGPADLAQSLGHRGEPQHPAVRAAADKVVTQASAAKRPVGVPLSYRDLPGFAGRAPGFLYYDLNAVIQAGAAATLMA